MTPRTYLFRFYGADRRDKAVPSEYDLRATGSRVSTADDVVEFAVATEKPWAYDYYAFFGLDPIGRQISVGY